VPELLLNPARCGGLGRRQQDQEPRSVEPLLKDVLKVLASSLACRVAVDVERATAPPGTGELLEAALDRGSEIGVRVAVRDERVVLDAASVDGSGGYGKGEDVEIES
jgi:hypothetical protein